MNSHLPYHRKHFDVIDSTNSYIKRHHHMIQLPYLITTNFQTQGRGRLDHKWDSYYGANLLMSLCIAKPMDQIGEMLKIAYCLIQLLNHYGIEASIKWPNDIYVHNQKIAGILCEVIDDKMIIGIGLNINDHIHYSFYTHYHRYFDKEVILEYFLDIYRTCFLNKKEIIDYLNNRSFLKNKCINNIIYGDLQYDGLLLIYRDHQWKKTILNEIHINK